MRGSLLISGFCLCALLLTATASQDFQLSFNMTGDPSDSPLGDLKGTALGLNGEDVFVGASGADGIPFPNGTVRPQAGRLSFLEKDRFGAWTQSQADIVGPAAYNKLTGTNIASRGPWLFVGHTGTPLDVDELSQKDTSGAIDVLRRQGRNWVFDHRLVNPDGNGPAQVHNEYGLHLAYTPKGGGWLLTGGGQTNRAWFHRYDASQGRFVPTQVVNTSAHVGNVIVAIDEKWAFIQVPLNANNFPAFIDNLQVLVYKRTGNVWNFHQTLSGYGNTGALRSDLGDLFGAIMSIDGRNAVIGAPGDMQVNPGPPGSFSLPGAAYFVRLVDAGAGQQMWQIVQKSFSDDPTFFYAFSNCIHEDVAVVADIGRTVGANARQGALRVYKRNEHTGLWTPSPDLLIDPHGREYDYLSSCALSRDYLIAGSGRGSTGFVPGSLGPALPGRFLIWDRQC